MNFQNPDWRILWEELKDVLLFWVQHGVRIFRVDNPHTKPNAFWEWVILEIQKDYPDVIFLAEAFTRPELMKSLAKLGFTQSYTYFAWRSTKWELTEYLTELTQTEMKYYFRPNFFPTTPDILPIVLVNLDPYNIQTGFAYVPLESFAINDGAPFQVEDLLTGEKFDWRGRRNFVMLDPHWRPAHIFRLRRLIGMDGEQMVFA